MPSTLRFGLQYPSGSSTPNVPLSMQSLAESTETALNTMPYKIASGTATLSFGAGVASVTSNVALPAGFTLPPVVTVTLASNVAGRASLLLLSAYSATTTGFTIKMQTSDNANIGTTYSLTFNWTAVQQTA